MSNTPSAHTRTEHTEWPRAVTPYPVLKPGCGVRVWAVASPPRPSRAPRATGLAEPGCACTGRASLPVGSHAQSLLGRCGNASGPASCGCGAPGPRLPPGCLGVDSGNPCPCGHVAAAQPWSLKQASGNGVGARCTHSGFLGLPSLSFWRNRSVPVASFAQKPKPWQSPPSRLTVQLVALFSKLSQRTRFPRVCASAAGVGRTRARRCGGSGGGWVPSARRAGPELCLPSLPFPPLSPGPSGGFRAVPTAPHRFDGVG